METESFLSQFEVDIFAGDCLEKQHTTMTIVKHNRNAANDCVMFANNSRLPNQNYFTADQIKLESLCDEFGGAQLLLKTSEHPHGLTVAVFFDPSLSEIVRLAFKAIGITLAEKSDEEDKGNSDDKQSLFALAPENHTLEVFADDIEELNKLDHMQSQVSDASQQQRSNKLILVDREGVIPPVKGHATDAGIDIFIQEDYLLQPGQTMYMPAGCKFDLHPDYHVEVVTRSSTSDRYPGLVVTPTIVDCEYAGEISTIATNTNSDRAIKIEKGSRIAQLLLKRHYYFDDADITILDQNSRDEGRFGSTGGN